MNSSRKGIPGLLRRSFLSDGLLRTLCYMPSRVVIGQPVCCGAVGEVQNSARGCSIRSSESPSIIAIGTWLKYINRFLGLLTV